MEDDEVWKNKKRGIERENNIILKISVRKKKFLILFLFEIKEFLL